MKNEKRDIRAAAAILGRIGDKAGTGKAKARTSEQARAAVMTRYQKLLWYGRERAKEELLERLASVGPCKASELEGVRTSKLIAFKPTASLATVRKYLNELQDEGRVRSKAVRHGMRTHHVWALARRKAKRRS